jgi:hypothetical protein
MIIQLTEAQRSVLEPAADREDRCIFPVTASLKGGAVGNVCKSLIKRGLVEAVPATDDSTVWSHGEDGVALTLIATEAGAQAVSGDPQELPEAASKPAAPAKPAAAKVEQEPAKRPNRGEQLVKLLKRARGATIAEMAEATGWQPHSVRGALSGLVGKKMGLTVTSEKVDGRGRVYRIA